MTFVEIESVRFVESVCLNGNEVRLLTRGRRAPNGKETTDLVIGLDSTTRLVVLVEADAAVSVPLENVRSFELVYAAAGEPVPAGAYRMWAKDVRADRVRVDAKAQPASPPLVTAPAAAPAPARRRPTKSTEPTPNGPEKP